MRPGHFDINGDIVESRQDVSPYTITATWERNLTMIHVAVMGDSIQGFLVQARLNLTEPAVGKFVSVSGNTFAKFQDCSQEPEVSKSVKTGDGNVDLVSSIDHTS